MHMTSHQIMTHLNHILVRLVTFMKFEKHCLNSDINVIIHGGSISYGISRELPIRSPNSYKVWTDPIIDVCVCVCHDICTDFVILSYITSNCASKRLTKCAYDVSVLMCDVCVMCMNLCVCMCV